MSEPSNPYQSPRGIVYLPKWRLRLRQWLMPRPETRFLRGQALLCEGIAYFIDRKSPKVLFAASPSTDESPEQMELIVAESLRLLPVLMAQHPALRRGIWRCKLRVRMIQYYSDIPDRYVHEIEIDESRLEAAKAAQGSGATTGSK